MELNREEIIWAAGFFDGEGWVGFVNADSNRRKSLKLSVAQTDRRVLDRFQAAVLGLGSVTGPYSTHGGNDKPVFQYQPNSFETVQAVIAMLYQFLSPVKQEQCLKALKAYSDWYPTVAHSTKKETCVRGHDYSNIRYDKRGRRYCVDCSNERNRSYYERKKNES